ncbi:MAG TPA: hypothetical protein VH253_11890 [Phycisphaerae bacterium]|nr:hypothetical protein [Phycisphaerae bacterium]
MNFTVSGLLSGLFISALGFGLLRYGKASANLFAVIAGMLMLVYPFFIYSVALLWLITAAICVTLYLLREKA